MPLYSFTNLRGPAGPAGATGAAGAAGASGVVDPSTTLQFYEDFVSDGFTAAAAVDALRSYQHAWRVTTDNPLAGSNVGGVVRLIPTSSTAPYLNHLMGGSNNGAGWVSPGKNPTIRVRYAQFGTGAATRMAGCHVAAGGGVTPADGIFWKATVGGDITAVCRNSNSESILSMATAAANGVFHELKAVVTGDGTSVEFFIDDVSKGSIVTNIPSAALKPVAGSSNTTGVTDGIDVDYFHITQTR